MTALDTTSQDSATLDALVLTMREALGRVQKPDGHWVFELEADATIPAEYVLMNHFLGTPEEDLEDKIGVYLCAAKTPMVGGHCLPKVRQTSRQR